MTPAEALADAWRATFDQGHMEPDVGERMATILAALPEPWRLIDVVQDEVEWEEVIAEERAEAAQQERERLRAALDAYLHVGDAWKPGILRWVRDDLLADPEPAK